MTTRRERTIFISLGLLLQVLSITLACNLDLHGGFIFFLAVYFAMFVAYLMAAFFVLREGREDKSLLGFIFIVAVTLRIPFLLTTPVFSDDIYRYIWDGRVQRQGINPYSYPPQSPELQHLRDPIYDGVNNKDIPTIYPPFMQVVFASVTAISESVIWMKGAFVLADLVLTGLLIRLLETMGMNPSRVMIYAWNPLVIVEVSGGGHNDVLALACLLAAHGAMIHEKDTLSIGSLSLSGLAKLMGFILAPLFLRSVRARAWVALPITCVIVSWPYLDVGPEAFRGLLEFASRWRANDSLFPFLLGLTGSLTAAKAVAVVIVLTIMGYSLYRKMNPLHSCYLTIGTILLLSTTVHPWYLIWIVPYLCFYPNPAWLLLTGTIVLAYHAPFLTPPGEPWVEHGLYKFLEYGPFFLLLTVLTLRRSRRLLRQDYAAKTSRAPR